MGGVLGIGVILAGCEGSHVVERTCFHRYAFYWNHYAHEISWL